MCARVRHTEAALILLPAYQFCRMVIATVLNINQPRMKWLSLLFSQAAMRTTLSFGVHHEISRRIQQCDQARA